MWAEGKPNRACCQTVAHSWSDRTGKHGHPCRVLLNCGDNAMYDVTPTGRSHARRMWRFQFSLRTLLLALTAASIGLSFVAVRMANARKQRRAVIAITRDRGRRPFRLPMGLPIATPVGWRTRRAALVAEAVWRRLFCDRGFGRSEKRRWPGSRQESSTASRAPREGARRH